MNASSLHKSPGSLAAIMLSFAVSAVFAGSTEYRVDVDSIEQTSPPGAVGHEQVLIINNDKLGNQQTLRIGNQGGTVTRPKPCKLASPAPGMDCTGRDLRGVEWADAKLSDARFDDADLRGALLAGAQLQNATFSDAKLDRADLRGADLTNADFSNARLDHARLAKATLVNATFMDASLPAADLSNTDLTNADFTSARLSGALLIKANLVNASFMDAELTTVDLSGANLVNAEFMAAQLNDATWADGRRCASGSVGECLH